MTWLWMLIGGYLIGFTAGCLVMVIVNKKKVFGTIRCNDGNNLYLVMDRDPEELRNVEYARFRVQLIPDPGSHE